MYYCRRHRSRIFPQLDWKPCNCEGLVSTDAERRSFSKFTLPSLFLPCLLASRLSLSSLPVSLLLFGSSSLFSHTFLSFSLLKYRLYTLQHERIPTFKHDFILCHHIPSYFMTHCCHSPHTLPYSVIYFLPTYFYVRTYSLPILNYKV